MSSRRAFKTDESFLEKISQGATGTNRVFQNLEQQGHCTIELERGSRGYKIWKKIKIKRVRVPDLLCVNCGTRIESRAKTELQITMSHSPSDAKRTWDYGFIDDDYVAFVKAYKTGNRPIDWGTDNLVQYVRVGDMRNAMKSNQVKEVKPKGVTEGYETRLVWSSAVAKDAGTVVIVDKDCIKYRQKGNGRIVRLSLKRAKHTLMPLVKVGDTVVAHQILASVVPVKQKLPCAIKATKEYYLSLLKSASQSDRFVAAKALAYFPSEETLTALTERMNCEKEHIYVRLECACDLLKVGNKDSLNFFKTILESKELENQLECVIALSEVDGVESVKLLIDTLVDTQKNFEIRAGSAWSLGGLRKKEAINALVSVFDAENREVKVESARALAKLSELYPKELINRLPNSTDEQKAGISWALTKNGNFSINELLSAVKSGEDRKWIAWIIGSKKETDFVSDLEELKQKDREVYFAVTVLWRILSSWTDNLEIY